MLELNNQDIEMLFKKLVILDEQVITEDITADTKAPITVKKVTKNITPQKAITPQIKTPLAVFTTTSIKNTLTLPDSNFTKIVKSLGVPELIENVYSVEESKIEQYNELIHVWLLGLNKDQVDAFGQIACSDIINTENPEVLTTKDEKLALFEPVKQFASRIK